MSFTPSAALIRAVVLWFPILIGCIFWVFTWPDQRERAGIFLALLWTVISLAVVNAFAQAVEVWQFQGSVGTLLGIPVEFLLGWAALWGVIPLLTTLNTPIWILAIAYGWLDIVAMPFLAPVLLLHPNWIWGELIAILIAFVPAQLLGRWTILDTHHSGRTALLIALFGITTLFFIPTVILEQTNSDWSALLERPAWQLSLIGQALAIPAIIGITSVRDFEQMGLGTPLPFDPPKQLVTNGPYAYIANPMQVSGSIMFLIWGMALQNWWVGTAAILAFVYSIGFANWSEQSDLEQRFAGCWQTYRNEVHAWRIRWTPYVAPSTNAELYLDLDCIPCSSLATWFRQRTSFGLTLVPAKEFTGAISRMTYCLNGKPIASGVAALGYSLEHIHFGWAFVGWILRFPIVTQLIQLLVDAVGGEAHDLIS